MNCLQSHYHYHYGFMLKDTAHKSIHDEKQLPLKKGLHSHSHMSPLLLRACRRVSMSDCDCDTGRCATCLRLAGIRIRPVVVLRE